MKNITNTLGRVIVVIAAVALLIGVVGVVAAPGISGFMGSVTSTMTDKGQDLLNSIGTPNAEGNGGSGGGAGGAGSEPDPELNPAGNIPAGAYYANLGTGTFYDTMPTTISDGDAYVYGDYIYMYEPELNGWSVSLATEDSGILNFIPSYPVTDRNQTSYSPILESINGAPIVSLSYTYFECSSLEVAPNIPNEVVEIHGAFHSCTSLTEIIIPGTVTELTSGAFYDCTNLTNIKFEGTVAEWNAVNVGNTGWNNNVPATEVVCSDGTVSLS